MTSTQTAQMTKTARFVDIHILQDLPPSCLNRDDNGTPLPSTNDSRQEIQ